MFEDSSINALRLPRTYFNVLFNIFLCSRCSILRNIRHCSYAQEHWSYVFEIKFINSLNYILYPAHIMHALISVVDGLMWWTLSFYRGVRQLHINIRGFLHGPRRLRSQCAVWHVPLWRMVGQNNQLCIFKISQSGFHVSLDTWRPVTPEWHPHRSPTTYKNNCRSPRCAPCSCQQCCVRIMSALCHQIECHAAAIILIVLKDNTMAWPWNVLIIYLL